MRNHGTTFFFLFTVFPTQPGQQNTNIYTNYPQNPNNNINVCKYTFLPKMIIQKRCVVFTWNMSYILFPYKVDKWSSLFYESLRFLTHPFYGESFRTHFSFQPYKRRPSWILSSWLYCTSKSIGLWNYSIIDGSYIFEL